MRLLPVLLSQLVVCVISMAVEQRPPAQCAQEKALLKQMLLEETHEAWQRREVSRENSRGISRLEDRAKLLGINVEDGVKIKRLLAPQGTNHASLQMIFILPLIVPQML